MQPELWHHHLQHADWWNCSCSPSLSSFREHDDTVKQCSGALCTSAQTWLLWVGKKHRKMDRWNCKLPFLLEWVSSGPCVCVSVCVSVSVCERVREEGTFSSQPPAAFAFTGETRQPNLFCFLLEIIGKGAVRFFSTVDLYLRTLTHMYGWTHEKQRQTAGEWVVEWLTTRMYQSGRLL